MLKAAVLAIDFGHHLIKSEKDSTSEIEMLSFWKFYANPFASFYIPKMKCPQTNMTTDVERTETGTGILSFQTQKATYKVYTFSKACCRPKSCLAISCSSLSINFNQVALP